MNHNIDYANGFYKKVHSLRKNPFQATPIQFVILCGVVDYCAASASLALQQTARVTLLHP